jgi:hypothetical protein
MKARDLLDHAAHLAGRSPKKPKQVDLRRAQSSVYYALFHRLCFLCAASLFGATSAAQQQKKWVRIYRQLGHAEAKKLCQDTKTIEGIHAELVGPADLFVQLQETRHRADYDPAYRPRRSEVLSDILRTRTAVDQIDRLPEVVRREFAIYLLFRQS